MTDTFWSGYGNALGAITGVANTRAQRQAGSALAGGDYRGASNTLLQSGDLQGGLRVRGIGQEQAAAEQALAQAAEAEQIAFTKQAVKALRESQNPLADFDAMAGAFRQLGTDDAQIAQLRQGLETGGRQFLDQVDRIANEQERALSFQKAGDTLYVFEDGNPNPVNTFEPASRPIEVGGVLVDPTTYQPILDTREPKTVTVQNSDGSSSIVQIDQPAPVSSAPRASGGGADAISVIQSILPNARFTSGLRTPDQNRSAGGAANSFHLRGQAVDIAPPAGVSLADFRRQLESSGVNVKELINEGDHWHIAWEGGPQAPNIGRGEPIRTSGGTRVVASGANNGPTPAAQRAEARQDEQDRRNQIRDTSTLRREFNARQEVKDFNTVAAAYDSVRAASRNPSAAGDLSMIFAYMKILDPGSVVREQEFANAQNAAGVPDRIRNLYNNVLNGERLNPRQRQDFLGQAESLYGARRQTYDRIAGEYRQEAEFSDLDPNRVVPQRGGGAQGLVSAPGLRFQITPGQSAIRQRITSSGGSPRARLGGRQNPYYVNPSDARGSYANVPSGAFFVTPDGEIRGPKP